MAFLKNARVLKIFWLFWYPRCYPCWRPVGTPLDPFGWGMFLTPRLLYSVEARRTGCDLGVIVVKHSLVDIDRSALMASCSICGPTPISKAGRGWACVVARREARARWKRDNPRVKSQRSPHALKGRKGGTDSCHLCGTVEAVAWGIGYMCPNRAKELGWTPPASPVARCTRCNRYPLKGGACPSCDARENTDLGYGFKLMNLARPKSGLRRVDAHDSYAYDPMQGSENEFMHMQVGSLALPDATESVVYGWKTLGAAVPWDAGQVNPDYAKHYGGGSNAL